MNAPLPKIDAEALRASLPEIGERLAAQLAELSVRPCVDKAERLAVNLEGARYAVLRYRERLAAEGGHGEHE